MGSLVIYFSSPAIAYNNYMTITFAIIFIRRPEPYMVLIIGKHDTSIESIHTIIVILSTTRTLEDEPLISAIDCLHQHLDSARIYAQIMGHLLIGICSLLGLHGKPTAVVIRPAATHHRPIRPDLPNTPPHRAILTHPSLNLGVVHPQRNRPRMSAAGETSPRRYARDIPAAIVIRFAGHAARRVDDANALSGGADSAHPFLDLRGIYIQRHRARFPAARQPAPGGYARDVAAAIGILAALDTAAGVGLELFAGGLASQLQGIHPRRAAHVQSVAGIRGLADANVAGFVDHQALHFGAGLDGQQIAVRVGGGIENARRGGDIEGQRDIAGDSRDDEYLVSESNAIPRP